MVLRRVVSAPADLAKMAHRKTQPAKDTPMEACKQDSLFAIASSTSSEGGFTDPTEHLFLYLVLKYMDEPNTGMKIIPDLFARIVCSILTHQLLKLMIFCLHNCVDLPSLG